MLRCKMRHSVISLFALLGRSAIQSIKTWPTHHSRGANARQPAPVSACAASPIRSAAFRCASTRRPVSDSSPMSRTITFNSRRAQPSRKLTARRPMPAPKWWADTPGDWERIPIFWSSQAVHSNRVKSAKTPALKCKTRRRSAAQFLAPSFRNGAQAPDLRCAIAHRGISRSRVRSFHSRPGMTLRVNLLPPAARAAAAPLRPGPGR
jgi:hypothetical protein